MLREEMIGFSGPQFDNTHCVQMQGQKIQQIPPEKPGEQLHAGCGGPLLLVHHSQLCSLLNLAEDFQQKNLKYEKVSEHRN